MRSQVSLTLCMLVTVNLCHAIASAMCVGFLDCLVLMFCLALCFICCAGCAGAKVALAFRDHSQVTDICKQEGDGIYLGFQ